MREPEATTKPPSNRRRSIRRRATRTVRVTCHQGAFGLGPNLATALLDVSESGARLRLKKALETGGEVEVGLQGPGHSRPLKQIARVIWSVASADGDFVTGVEFQKYLRYADLQALS